MFKLLGLNSITTFGINIILIFLFLLVGGILPLYERKVLALTQRRIGPKYVGYKGRLQFVADALKILLKDYLLLIHILKLNYLILPVIFINLNLILWINITWFNNICLINTEFNILFFIILNSLSHILIFLVGICCKNKYTIISSTRLLNNLFSIDLFISGIIIFIIFSNNSFSLDASSNIQSNHWGIWYYIPIIPVLLISFLMDNAKAPFDQVEAETEIIMGYHVEYSGFMFGIFVLAEYLHVFFFTYLIGGLFFGLI